ncbi:MAG: Ppx/GppA phosphatase [Bacteriovoracaceae bacterium]|nr:Ppx/GppA phosphatase [Bacteriovoracaceae bacterium]
MCRPRFSPTDETLVPQIPVTPKDDKAQALRYALRMSNRRVAAIDIGSNSILLTIVEARTPLHILVDEATVTGLSKGLSKEGLIQPDRLKKSLDTLSKYRALLDEHDVKEVKVAATEALRKAKNGEEVRKQIEQVLKLPVDLIPGDREAELSFWSVQKDFADRKAKKLVFDIGGASTELCYGSDRGIEHRISLKVGSVLLSEKFGLKNKSDGSEASKYVWELLKPLNWKTEPCLGFGVAGTITTALAVEMKMTQYQRSKVHGQSISRDRIEFWRKEILSRNLDERRDLPGLPFDRADVFGGGVTIISVLMDYFKWNEVICMDSGVRFGLIYEMLGL